MVAVTFELPGSIWAEHVSVTGDFNGWHPYPMRRDDAHENWYASLELRAGETFRFTYLVDGRPVCDCQADGFARGNKGEMLSVVKAVMPYVMRNP